MKTSKCRELLFEGAHEDRNFTLSIVIVTSHAEKYTKWRYTCNSQHTAFTLPSSTST